MLLRILSVFSDFLNTKSKILLSNDVQGAYDKTLEHETP